MKNRLNAFMKTVLLAVILFTSSTPSAGQIISYSINQAITGPGQLTFDIDNAGGDDLVFEIIDLSPNGLGARVLTIGSTQMLDNSTWGYPDALDLGDTVTGYFHAGTGVLGTFTTAGQFNGMGNKYLGVKIGSGSRTGWVLLNCSTNRDTLRIISCGYLVQSSGMILAGQTGSSGTEDIADEFPGLVLYPNPVSESLHIHGFVHGVFYYTLFNINGDVVAGGETSGGIETRSIPGGTYLIRLYRGRDYTCRKVLVRH